MKKMLMFALVTGFLTAAETVYGQEVITSCDCTMDSSAANIMVYLATALPRHFAAAIEYIPDQHHAVSEIFKALYRDTIFTIPHEEIALDFFHAISSPIGEDAASHVAVNAFVTETEAGVPTLLIVRWNGKRKLWQLSTADPFTLKGLTRGTRLFVRWSKWSKSESEKQRIVQ